jgi:hypothetical protein
MKSDFIILSILFISGLFACNGNNNIQLVKEWQGKEIKLPSFLLETFRVCLKTNVNKKQASVEISDTNSLRIV